MKYVMAVVQIMLVAMALLYGVTFWAIDKSRERTECYQRTQTHAESGKCAQPGAFEQLVRRVLT